MLKQVSLLLTCESGHVGISILISKKWFLFRQQKENQPSPHVTPRVCCHAQTGQSSARCILGHVRILLLISKKFLFWQRKENQPHLMSPLEYATMLKQVSLLLTCVSVRAYWDLDSHFKVVSVPAMER
jgi:hypothetical protein